MLDRILHDWTMWNYGLTLVVSIYGTLLFAWWAKKAGRPSSVFLYVMCIFIAEGWAMGIAAYARLEHLYISVDQYNDFITYNWMWFLRQLPTTIILFLLATHMSIRAFCRRKHRAANGKKPSYDAVVNSLAVSEASRLVSEAAIVAAEIVAVASSEAAKTVAKEAKKAAAQAQVTTDHILAAIRNINKGRSTD